MIDDRWIRMTIVDRIEDPAIAPLTSRARGQWQDLAQNHSIKDSPMVPVKESVYKNKIN